MPLTKIQSLGITDGTIVNADINASAAIASTKLSGVANTPIVNAIRTGTTQSISATTWTKLIFNTEKLDTGNIYDNTTGVVTIPTTGKYYVSTSINVRALNGTSEYAAITIQNSARNSSTPIANFSSGNSGYGWSGLTISHALSYSANDTIAIWVYGSEAFDIPDEAMNLTVFKIIE